MSTLQLDQELLSLLFINSSKRKQLAEIYGLTYHWKDVSELFESLSPIGNRPRSFQWDTSRTEDQHADDYTNYVKDYFIGNGYLEGKVLKDVHMNKTLFNTNETRRGLCMDKPLHQSIHKSSYL